MGSVKRNTAMASIFRKGVVILIFPTHANAVWTGRGLYLFDSPEGIQIQES